jgi:hypothetical protein
MKKKTKKTLRDFILKKFFFVYFTYNFVCFEQLGTHVGVSFLDCIHFLLLFFFATYMNLNI